MIDLAPVMAEHERNIGFLEGPNNLNPWGPEQGVKNAAYCDSGCSMVPYHNGLRWWTDCQFGEKGCAYTVYHVNAALRHGRYIYDHASKGQPCHLDIGDPVFFDWTNNGGVDHVETVSAIPQGSLGEQYETIGYNTGPYPGGCFRQIRDRKYLHGVIKMSWAYSTAPAPPAPPPLPPMIPDRLKLGQRMTRGQELRSADGAFKLVLQASDGNLVIYPAGKSAVWATNKTNGDFFILQSDGNLVQYQGNRALWSPNVQNRGGVKLIMQSDGNLVLYRADNRAVWASKQGVL